MLFYVLNNYCKASGDSKESEIFELSDRSEREREIGRMATGSLETSAGVELARALLDMDFD